MRNLERKFVLCIIISLCVSIILSSLFLVGFMSNNQLKLSDNLYGGKKALNSIIIVSIDDKSLQEIGRWPWQRERFTEFFYKVNNSKAILVDVAFFENYSEIADKELGEAIKSNGNVILAMEYTDFEKQNGKVIGKEFMLPIEPLRNSAKELAYINILTDADGITRAILWDLSREYPSFAYSGYKNYFEKEISYDNQRFLINFIDKPGSFQTVSFSDVINNRTDLEIFKDKLVLVGTTSPDLHDDYFVPTSYGKAMPGVEIHANAIQTVINKSFLKEQPKLSVIFIIFLFSIIVSLLLYKTKIWVASVISFFLLLGYILFSIKIFDYGIIMNLVYPVITVLFTFIPIVSSFYLFEEKQKRKIKNAFSKYVSHTLVEQIVRNPDKLKLGGEKKEITIFFSDIRGFTTISEKLKPEQLVHILNEYLTAMTNIIMNHNGLVDKYIGDAIMALWNVPLDENKHAELACIASLEMKNKLAELNNKWHQENPELKETLNIGIGLNTGEAIIGNVGSEERFDYTAIGDCVNLASRIEGLNKNYRTNTIISENTLKSLKEIGAENKFILRELDYVSVKGKKEPIKIYELICLSEEFNEEIKEIIKNFEQGLKLYREKKFDKAVEFFKKNEGDEPSKIFIERCKYFKQNPPEENWDFVWIMKEK